MKNFKKIAVLLVILFGTSQVFAQKVAYVKETKILESIKSYGENVKYIDSLDLESNVTEVFTYPNPLKKSNPILTILG